MYNFCLLIGKRKPLVEGDHFCGGCHAGSCVDAKVPISILRGFVFPVETRDRTLATDVENLGQLIAFDFLDLGDPTAVWASYLYAHKGRVTFVLRAKEFKSDYPPMSIVYSAKTCYYFLLLTKCPKNLC